MGELDLVQAGRDFAEHCHRLHPSGADVVARMADELELLHLGLAQVRAEQVRLMRWKRRWDELGHLMLEDHENTFDHADRVLEVMDALESGVNPDD